MLGCPGCGDRKRVEVEREVDDEGRHVFGSLATRQTCRAMIAALRGA